jgi:glycosyltransferase involved in cell wall biosynthesis
MRIAQVAPLMHPVPPPGYGGTERVIALLTEELIRRGHQVTLFAAGDSQTGATLVPMTPRALADPRSPKYSARRPRLELLAMLSDVYSRANEFDVIHSHAEEYTLPFARMVSQPTVMTMHSRLDRDELGWLFTRMPGVALVSVSMAQRAPLNGLPSPWAGCVPNGIAVHRYRLNPRPGSYLLFVGRICPDKRPDLAVRVARAVGLPLKVAATIHRVDQAYWADVVRPLFEQNNVEFLGEVREADKPDLYAGAFATLFPSDWPEPFGLVVLESLAAGTPVVALDRGAIRELLTDGVHGFIRPDAESMARALDAVDGLDRAECRAQAMRFGPAQLADGYERIYRRIAAAR